MDFETLVDEHSTHIYRFCLSLTRHRDRAEDLIQDVYIEVAKLLPRFATHPNPRALLFRVAILRYRNSQRQLARRHHIAPTDTLTPELSATLSTGEHIENELIAREEAALLNQLVHQLPDKYKLPIIMHYTNHLPLEQIAQAMGIPKGTVKSRLHKARQLLKKGMMSHGYEA